MGSLGAADRHQSDDIVVGAGREVPHERTSPCRRPDRGRGEFDRQVDCLLPRHSERRPVGVVLRAWLDLARPAPAPEGDVRDPVRRGGPRPAGRAGCCSPCTARGGRLHPMEPDEWPWGSGRLPELACPRRPICSTTSTRDRHPQPEAAEVLPQLTAAGRSPLTIAEGLAVLASDHGVLRSRNCFSLLGSRAGDKRVPALWVSERRPRLGWCYQGAPHTWLGSASCAARRGLPLGV